MIQVVRRSIVDVYNQYNFTRQSLAYDSKGRLYHLHNARFEPGRFGQAVMVEEGTTNLFTAPKDFTNSAWVKDNLTVTADATTAPNGLQEADKLVPTAVKGWVVQKYSVDPANKSFTFSVWLKADAPHYALIKVQNNDNTECADKRVYVTTSWQRFDVTKSFTLTGKTNVEAIIWPGDYNGTTDYVYAWGAQLEQKPYPTSFTDSTRSPETLTIPTAGVLNPAGPYTLEVYSQKTVRDILPFVFFKDWRNYARFGYRSDYDKYELRLVKNGVTIFATYSSALGVSGFVYSALVFTGTKYIGYANGQKVVEVISSEQIGSDWPFTPGNLANYCINGLIDDLRISSRARTDEEISAAYASNAPLPVDADTTLKLDFDGPDTQRAAKVLVV